MVANAYYAPGAMRGPPTRDSPTGDPPTGDAPLLRANAQLAESCVQTLHAEVGQRAAEVGNHVDGERSWHVTAGHVTAGLVSLVSADRVPERWQHIAEGLESRLAAVTLAAERQPLELAAEVVQHRALRTTID